MRYEDRFETARFSTQTEPVEVDVRDLPPPEPLQETLGTLESMDADKILVQINDREPMHLFPMLEERGYSYECVGDDPAYTAIWME